VTEAQPTNPSLAGFTIGITADRRGDDQAVMFRRLGAEVVQGPTIQTLSVPDRDELTKLTEEIISAPPDFLIANTGLGIRTWMAHAAEVSMDEKLKGALAKGRIAARGPKAAAAVTMAGLTVWWRSPGEQLAEVAGHLLTEGVRGRRVAFQLHGDDARDVSSRLQKGGAEVIEIPVYRWTTPEGGQLDRALNLIDLCCRRQVDAVTFTAGPQVRNMMELADASNQVEELRSALNSGVLVGCIGPVCAGVAREEGIVDPIVPANWRLGSLVRAVAGALTGTAPIQGPVQTGPVQTGPVQTGEPG
jgi:uroporphyrinogen-III synthase